MNAIVTAPEGAQTLTITREFDAPAEAVYRAHVDPELFVRWNGPDDVATQVRSWDARTGGNWSYLAWVGQDAVGFYGSFHELRDAQRIVQTFTYEPYPDAVLLEIMTFTDLADGRSRLDSISVFDSVDSRDGMVASGMETGIQQGYAKLDGVLAA